MRRPRTGVASAGDKDRKCQAGPRRTWPEPRTAKMPGRARRTWAGAKDRKSQAGPGPAWPVCSPAGLTPAVPGYSPAALGSGTSGSSRND